MKKTEPGYKANPREYNNNTIHGCTKLYGNPSGTVAMCQVLISQTTCHINRISMTNLFPIPVKYKCWHCLYALLFRCFLLEAEIIYKASEY